MVNRDNYAVVRHYMDFCAEVRQHSPKTVARRWQHLRHLLEWADEKPFVQAPGITPTFPRCLITARLDGRGDRLCNLQQSQILSDIRLFLRWYRTSAHRLSRQLSEGWIETLQPVKQVEPPKERDVFTLEEVRSVLAAPALTLSEERDRAAVAFLFLSGMRVGAFATLGMDCVDLNSRAVKQWPSLGVETKFSKTATTHLLPIEDLLAVVRGWDAKVRRDRGPTGPWYARLLPDGEGFSEEWMTQAAAQMALMCGMHRLCERAGVKYHSPHKLRHGHAAYAIKQAKTVAELKAISQNLMHSNLSTTDGIYGILSQQDVGDTIAALGGGDRHPDVEVMKGLDVEALAALIASKMKAHIDSAL